MQCFSKVQYGLGLIQIQTLMKLLQILLKANYNGFILG